MCLINECFLDSSGFKAIQPTEAAPVLDFISKYFYSLMKNFPLKQSTENAISYRLEFSGTTSL